MPEEKAQMIRIKYEEIRNPNYSPVRRDTNHLMQSWSQHECLYCDDDACEGC
jgi:hypothetical protein